MFSRAVAFPAGVSRKALVTIVRLPRAVQNAQERAANKRPTWQYHILVDALTRILDDVITRQIQRHAVVSMSIGLAEDTANPQTPENMVADLKKHLEQTSGERSGRYCSGGQSRNSTLGRCKAKLCSLKL